MKATIFEISHHRRQGSASHTRNRPLTRYVKLQLQMRRECRNQVSDPSMYHGMCHTCAVMHVGIANPQWRENIRGIPGACHTRNFTYLARGPCHGCWCPDDAWSQCISHHNIVICFLQYTISIVLLPLTCYRLYAACYLISTGMVNL